MAGVCVCVCVRVGAKERGNFQDSNCKNYTQGNTSAGEEV